MKQEKAIVRLFSGKKAFSLALAVLLVLGCSVGATLAYLTATTETVTNTFTVGKVDITLQEHKYDESSNSLGTDTVQSNTYKLIPGKHMPKDPFVTVKAGSEKCWLFVRIDEANNKAGDVDPIVHYLAADGWTNLPLTGYDDSGIEFYCRIVDASASDRIINVLGRYSSKCEEHDSGCVCINPEVTSDFTDTPALKFTAAAIQYDGLELPAGYSEMEDTNGATFKECASQAFVNLPDAFKSTANLNTPAPEGGDTVE